MAEPEDSAPLGASGPESSAQSTPHPSSSSSDAQPLSSSGPEAQAGAGEVAARAPEVEDLGGKEKLAEDERLGAEELRDEEQRIQDNKAEAERNEAENLEAKEVESLKDMELRAEDERRQEIEQTEEAEKLRAAEAERLEAEELRAEQEKQEAERIKLEEAQKVEAEQLRAEKEQNETQKQTEEAERLKAEEAEKLRAEVLRAEEMKNRAEKMKAEEAERLKAEELKARKERKQIAEAAAEELEGEARRLQDQLERVKSKAAEKRREAEREAGAMVASATLMAGADTPTVNGKSGTEGAEGAEGAQGAEVASKVVVATGNGKSCAEGLGAEGQGTEELKGHGENDDPAIPQHDRASLAKIALASTVGNVLEWYDFGVFAFLAPQIGSNFFPRGDPATRVMNAFIVFGGAFVIRPVGGVLVGHIGDHYGRKSALLFTVVLMAGATFTIGCLPTYESIGVAAPLLLTVMRLLQGLSVGGEVVGSIIYAVESAPEDKKVFMGSLCTTSAIAGTTLGSWTGLVLHAVLTDEQLYDFGWRIPFWSGLLIGGFALWVRRNLGESAEFQQQQEEAKRLDKGLPLFKALKEEKVSILLAFLMASVYGFGAWFLATFPPVLYLDLMDPPLGSDVESRRGESGAVYKGHTEIWIMHTLLCCIFFACVPLWGVLGDKFGNRKCLTLAGLAVSIAAIPGAMAMGYGSVASACIGQATLMVLMGAVAANFPTYLVQTFPVDVRFSCIAIGYNLALALFGGTAGIVGTYFYKTYHSTHMIGAYFSALAFTSACSVSLQTLRMKRSERMRVMRSTEVEFLEKAPSASPALRPTAGLVHQASFTREASFKSDRQPLTKV